MLHHKHEKHVVVGIDSRDSVPGEAILPGRAKPYYAKQIKAVSNYKEWRDLGSARRRAVKALSASLPSA